MQSETGFPSSHQLKSYVASKSRLKLAARAVLSAYAGLLVTVGILSSVVLTTAGHATHWPVATSEINQQLKLTELSATKPRYLHLDLYFKSSVHV